jgi:hypothetical protein
VVASIVAFSDEIAVVRPRWEHSANQPAICLVRPVKQEQKPKLWVGHIIALEQEVRLTHIKTRLMVFSKPFPWDCTGQKLYNLPTKGKRQTIQLRMVARYEIAPDLRQLRARYCRGLRMPRKHQSLREQPTILSEDAFLWSTTRHSFLENEQNQNRQNQYLLNSPKLSRLPCLYNLINNYIISRNLLSIINCQGDKKGWLALVNRVFQRMRYVYLSRSWSHTSRMP